MARGDIRQRISLEGGEEVRRQLQQMGKAGEDAIRSMDRAVLSANSGLGSLATHIAAARAHMDTMHASFTNAGNRLHDLNGKLAIFGNAMRASAGTILPFNANLLAMAAALTAVLAPLAVFAQAKKAALAVDDLVDTADNLGTTTEQLQALKLMAAESGGDVSRLGVALGKLNIATAEGALKTKGFVAEQEGGTAVLRGGAQAAADAAKVLRGGMQQLATETTNGVTTLRGVGAAAGGVKDAFQILGTTAAEMFKLAPFERLGFIADRFIKLKSETLQTKVANELFGRSYQDMMQMLKGGSAGLAAAEASVKRLGIAVGETEKGFSAGFLKAFAQIEAQFGSVTTFIGNVIGNTLIPLFGALSKVIGDNFDAIRARALEMGKAVVPIVDDIVRLIQGVGKEGLQTGFMQGMVTAFEQVKAAATIAFEVIKTGFLIVADVLAPIAAGINAVFGTQLTGTTLAAAAAVLYFAGAFNLLAAAIGVVTAAVAAVVAVFGTAFSGVIVAATIAFALLVALWFKHSADVTLVVQNMWTLIKDTWASGTLWIQQTWDVLFAYLIAGINTIGDWFAGHWEKIRTGFTSVASWIGQQLDWIIQKAKQAGNAITSALGGGSGGVIATAPIPVNAQGGLIRGPGTGTSDSILAQLSDYEYVNTARAVRFWGPDVFASLNRLQMPKFALGGLVDAMNSSLMPRSRSFGSRSLAAAGSGSGGRPVHLHLDGQSFALRGEQNVVEALGKQARSRRVRSGGRAPSWVG